MASNHPNRTLRDFYNAAEPVQNNHNLDQDRVGNPIQHGENPIREDDQMGQMKSKSKSELKSGISEESQGKKMQVGKGKEKTSTKQTLPPTYHFPASLAKPNSTSIDQPQRETTLKGSESNSVDLDLSFDYVSKLEQKKKDQKHDVPSSLNSNSNSNSTKIVELPLAKSTKIVPVDLPSIPASKPIEQKGKGKGIGKGAMSISISPPSPQPPKGMSGASWSARKGPPAPLSLKRRSEQKIPQEISVFSPDTEVGIDSDSDVDLDLPGNSKRGEEEQEAALPITPLSATRRSKDTEASMSNDELAFGIDPRTGLELPLSPSMQKVMVNSTPLPLVELPVSATGNDGLKRPPPSEPLPPIPLPKVLDSRSSSSTKGKPSTNFRPSFPPEAVYPLSNAANSLGLSFDDPSSLNPIIPTPSNLPLDENTKPHDFNHRNRSTSSKSRNYSHSISSKRSKRPDTGNSNVSGKSFQTANTRPSTDVDDGRSKRDSFESFETADGDGDEGGELEEMDSMIQDMDQGDGLDFKSEERTREKSNLILKPRFSNHSSRPSLGALSSALSDQRSDPSIYSLNRHAFNSSSNMGTADASASSPSNSHSSPRTPFSPLFSDPGTARSNWTMATSAVPTPVSQTVKLPEFSMVRTGSAPVKSSKQLQEEEEEKKKKVIQEIKLEDRTIGLPRSETEEWIKALAKQHEREGNNEEKRKREISNETNSTNSCYSSEINPQDEELEVENHLMIIEPPPPSSSSSAFSSAPMATSSDEIPKRKRRPTLIVNTEDQGDESEFDILRKSLDQSKVDKNFPKSPLLLSPATSNFKEKELNLGSISSSSVANGPNNDGSSAKVARKTLIRRALTDVSKMPNPSQSEKKSTSGIGLGLEFGDLSSFSSPPSSAPLAADTSFELGLGPRNSLDLPLSNSLKRFHSDNSIRRNYLKRDDLKIDMKDPISDSKMDENNREGKKGKESDGFGGFRNALGLSLNGNEKGFKPNSSDPPMTAPILSGWRKPEPETFAHSISQEQVQGKNELVKPSPSVSSSLEGFACHVTPPIPAASNLNSTVQIQRAAFKDNLDSLPLSSNGKNEMSLLPMEEKPQSAWDVISNSRWSSKFWSVASSAGLSSVLSSRRNSDLNAASGKSLSKKDGILVSNNKSPLTGAQQAMKPLNLVDRRKNDKQQAVPLGDGTVSAPTSSTLTSRSTFEPSPNLNHQKIDVGSGPISSASSPMTSNLDQSSPSAACAASRKQKRNSRIHYISNGNEIRLDMREREKSGENILDSFKSPRVRDSPTGQTPDMHFAVPISKSKWSTLPGDESKEVEKVLGEEMEIGNGLQVERSTRRHSSILPMGESESSNGLPIWLRGETFESDSLIAKSQSGGMASENDGGLQASRDKLRLLASQTMPGATLPHEYLSCQSSRKRIATTRPSHRPTSSTSAIPTATIVPFGWTSVKNHSKRDSRMHLGTLIKDSNGIPMTTRFAKGTKDDLNREEGEKQLSRSESTDDIPVTSGRPMSIFVPTSSIQAHLLRNSGLNLTNQRNRMSFLNHLTPKNVLESSKPSRTLFFAGCLGMPWLWLIGGWWLGEDGLIITTGLDRVEMWKHEASMRNEIQDQDSLHQKDENSNSSSSSSSQETLLDRKERASSLPPAVISDHENSRRESFRRENSAPPEIPFPSKSMAKIRSHSTMRSFSSTFNDLSTPLNVSKSSERIPKTRSDSIASILAFKPEVNFFQSPIRPIPEGSDLSNPAHLKEIHDDGGKASPRIDNENPSFEGVETVTGFKNRPNSISSLHSRKKSKSTINMNLEEDLEEKKAEFALPKSTFEEDEEEGGEGTSLEKRNQKAKSHSDLDVGRRSIFWSNHKNKSIHQQVKNQTRHNNLLKRVENYLVYLNRLDRFVLYNRIAALVSSLLVFGSFGLALFYLVANF